MSDDHTPDHIPDRTRDGAPPDSSGASDGPWWRTTWPLGWRELIELGGWLILVVAVWTAAGWLLTDVLAPNPVTDFDDEFVRGLADGRTDRRTDLAERSSMLSATHVKIIVTTLLAIGMLALWRRWRDALLVAVSLVFEASAFVITSYIVARPRPEDRLLDSPVDTSFPSGHVAAAAAYAALVVIVFWHTRSRIVRVVSIVLVGGIVAAVSWARMYQGMHHPSDVIAGIALGLISVAICQRVIARGVDRRSPEMPRDDPAREDVVQQTTPYHGAFRIWPDPNVGAARNPGL